MAGQFLLPLQAEKSTREQVIESIRERLEMNDSRDVREYDEKVRQFRHVREQLADYIELISSSYAQTGLTVHEILGKSISTNPRLQGVSNDVLGLGTIHSQFLSSSGLASLRTIGEQLEKAHSGSAGAKPIWKNTGLLNPDRFTIEDICVLSKRASVQLIEVANARDALASYGLEDAPKEFLKAVSDCLETSLPLLNMIGTQPFIELLLRDDSVDKLDTFASRCKVANDSAAALSDLLAVGPSQEAYEAISQTICVCQQFDIATISRGELAAEFEVRRSSAQTSKRVAAVLEPLALSLPASASWNISEISTARSLIDAAGREALLFRKVRTNESNSSYRLLRLCEEGLELQAIKAELASRSSPPSGVTIEQLTTCASIIRSSGALSIFSAHYRKAKRLCLSISRTNFSKPDALRLLEELIEFRRCDEEFNHHCTTTGLFGPEFRGLATRFDLFKALARYYEEIESKLGGPTNAAIRAFLREEKLSVLDLLPSFGATTLAMNYETLRQRVVEVEADGHRIEQAIKELHTCENVLRNENATRTELEGVGGRLLKDQALLYSTATQMFAQF